MGSLAVYEGVNQYFNISEDRGDIWHLAQVQIKIKSDSEFVSIFAYKPTP